jgi:GNAT superfamily N-acetyltransferase
MTWSLRHVRPEELARWTGFRNARSAWPVSTPVLIARDGPADLHRRLIVESGTGLAGIGDVVVVDQGAHLQNHARLVVACSKRLPVSWRTALIGELLDRAAALGVSVVWLACPSRHVRLLAASLLDLGLVAAESTVVFRLDLRSMQPAAVGGPHAGYEIVPFTDLDSPARRRELTTLVNEVAADVPTGAQWTYDDGGLDTYWFRSAAAIPEAVTVAVNGRRIVGVTALGRTTRRSAEVLITGVLPEHRGRGVARALKIRSSVAARDRGVTLVFTENETDNELMRNLNESLGFVAVGAVLAFRGSSLGRPA